MWLYHGTYDMFYKSIKRHRAIIPNTNTDEVTLLLDREINKTAGRTLRGECVYLYSDREAMDGFDRFFRISTSRLNTSRLFVADNRQLDFILATLGTDKCSQYAKKYIDSYVNFRYYLDNKEEYNSLYRPEFLYFGSIEIS